LRLFNDAKGQEHARRALCPHFRNLADDQLRALAQNGGVIGMSYVPMFVDQTAPTLSRLLDHIDQVVKVEGIETVGLGPDFDGGRTLLRDVAETTHIVEELIPRGYGKGDIRKILGENTLRVLRATIG
jgi:membrane dipeptidase